MPIIYPDNVSILIQKEILKGLKFANPTGGLSYSVSPFSQPEISGQIDQFLPRLPFKPINAAQLEQPTLSYSNDDLFTNTGLNSVYFPNPTAELTDVEMNFTDVTEDPGYTRTMSSVAGLLEISSAGLGDSALEEMLAEFELGFREILRRFLSVATIYGGYYPASGDNWFYYQTSLSPTDGWNQSLAFDGLHKITTPASEGGLGAGYRAEPLGSVLNLGDINSFLADFKGSNNGHIDYLVMNSQLRTEYINLWHGLSQVPQYITDPMTGKLCLAHDGIPILVNDYIMTYDFNADAYYLSSDYNPENVLFSPSAKQTSMFALCVGEESNGIFGIFPSSFGDGSSPMKIERQESSQTKDTILLKGTIQAGMGFHTRRSVGQLPGIVIP